MNIMKSDKFHKANKIWSGVVRTDMHYVVVALVVILASSCGGSDAGPADASEPDAAPSRIEILEDIPIADLGLPDLAPGFDAVSLGIFIAIPAADTYSWTSSDATGYVREIVENNNTILAQCNLQGVVETAQVISVPADLLDFKGNEPGSYGGHPPDGTENPLLFNYEQNERLTEDALELFGYGKEYTSKNAISVFTVEEIEYYSGGSFTNQGAGGLSHPPNSYHHVDDYPMRNSVLLVPTYDGPGALPRNPASNVLAHELGHMLLNNGDHEQDMSNLMSGWGTTLTMDQCSKMTMVLDWLYGDDEVPDPGPPQ